MPPQRSRLLGSSPRESVELGSETLERALRPGEAGPLPEVVEAGQVGCVEPRQETSPRPPLLSDAPFGAGTPGSAGKRPEGAPEVTRFC